MTGSIAELQRLGGNCHVVADLTKTREGIRADHRRQFGNAATSAPNDSEKAIADRVRRTSKWVNLLGH